MPTLGLLLAPFIVLPHSICRRTQKRWDVLMELDMPVQGRETHNVTPAEYFASSSRPQASVHKQAVAKLDFKFLKQTFRVSFLLTVMFGLPAIIAVGMLCNEARIVRKMRRAKREREQLHNTVCNALSQAQDVLSNFKDLNAQFAEGIFEDMKRDFVKSMKSIYRKDRLHALQDPRFLVLFRKYVKQWLKLFQECSCDPLRRPTVVVLATEINACETIAEIANLLQTRLNSTEISVMPPEASALKEEASHRKADLNQDDDKWTCTWCEFVWGTRIGVVLSRPSSKTKVENNPHGNCFAHLADLFPIRLNFCCLKLKIISRRHLLLLGTTFAAIPLAYMHFRSRNFMCVVFTCIVEIACAYSLIFFESTSQLAALEHDLLTVRNQANSIEESGGMIRQRANDFEKLTKCWLQRTIPCFHILKEVQRSLEDQLFDLVADDAVDLLVRSISGIDTMMTIVGPLAIWLGASSLSPNKLQVISSYIIDETGNQGPNRLPRQSIKINENGRASITLQQIKKDKHLAAKLYSWDLSSTRCECGVEFGKFHPRKHCRCCSKAVCRSCSQRRMPVIERGYITPVRVCDQCSKWTKDTEATKCKLCQNSLGKRFLRPRRHCRNCGDVFCGSCCDEWSAIPRKGYVKKEQVCKTCKRELKTAQQEDKADATRQNRVVQVLRNIKQVSFVTICVFEAHVPSVSELLKISTAGGLFGQISPDDLMDTYVSVHIDNRFQGKTEIVWNDPHPRWNQEFFFNVEELDGLVTLKVWHRGPAGVDYPLGTVDIKLRRLTSGEWLRNSVHKLDAQFGDEYDITIDVLLAVKTADLLSLQEDDHVSDAEADVAESNLDAEQGVDPHCLSDASWDESSGDSLAS